MKPEKFLQEANVMKELIHPNIIKLLAIISRDEPLMIITEFMDKGSLESFFEKPEGQNLEEHHLRSISFEVT